MAVRSEVHVAKVQEWKKGQNMPRNGQEQVEELLAHRWRKTELKSAWKKVLHT